MKPVNPRLRLAAIGLVCALVLPSSPRARAVEGEHTESSQPDIAPCLAAAAADDEQKVASLCAGVIDDEKTARPDRIKALIARAAFHARHGRIDQAIADDDRVLQLDAALADVHNDRGELWRRKGDRLKAVQDFAAALRIDPANARARANNRELALELERAGAQMAVSGKPSFECARATRPVQKAICADHALADLDREIAGMNARGLGAARTAAEARALRRAQDQFVARRDAGFGRAGYDLKQAMQDRLRQLTGRGP